MKLSVAGGGKMAEALVGGLIANRWADAEEIAVIEPVADRRAELASSFPGLVLVESCGAAAGDPALAVSDVLVAVKPQHVAEVAADLGPTTSRVLSIAAGVRLEALAEGFGPQARVIRAMPNTPALVGQGAAAIAGSSNATDDDLAWAETILSSVGSVTVVDEADLDAVTGLSGSGPAYLFLLAESMTAAGIAQGLAPDVADALTRQTLLGAATLLSASDDDPSVLRANVTSPGGTTAAAIASFQSNEFERLVLDAITAATSRSMELGESPGS